MTSLETDPGLTVTEIVDLLGRVGRTRQLSPTVAVTQLDHALQTAALLARESPDDIELAVAGLVHDLGHLLPEGTDEAHAEQAAAAVREVLGGRVAGIVGLHVEAKRYLVTVEGGYDGELTEDSVISLRRQGGGLSVTEAAEFAALPLASEAVTLRRADDHGKAAGLVVQPLSWWVPVLEGLARLGGDSTLP